MSDLGIQANANEDSISNQSGDTFLLTDDEAGTVNTYADILHHRETTTPTPVTPSSQTDFERNNFNRDNVTPGRPCTAYFSSAYFVDSNAVFDKLVELDFPRESVLCLQRRPSGDMVITFVDQKTKRKFVSRVVIRFWDSSAVINDEDMPYTF